MAPLPDDWKIIGMDEDVTFRDNADATKKRNKQKNAPHEQTAPATAAAELSYDENAEILDVEPVEEYSQPDSNATLSKQWNNPEFRLRVISAAILAPIVLTIVAAGGAAFYMLVLVAAVLMMREWDAMNHHRNSTLWGWLGVAYVCLTCLAMIMLREPSLGGSLSLIIYLLAVVWATDIGAYFAGRQVGGPKLAPRISPNKTWAGLVGGVISAIAVGGILSLFFAFPFTITQAGWLGALLAVVAQAGDLFESWMKRMAGIKDSGTLIPGHGGILDRVDGLTFSAPLLVLLYHTLQPATTVVLAAP